VRRIQVRRSEADEIAKAEENLRRLNEVDAVAQGHGYLLNQEISIQLWRVLEPLRGVLQ